MSKVDEIVAIVEQESSGLFVCILPENGITKEGLVRQVLDLSN